MDDLRAALIALRDTWRKRAGERGYFPGEVDRSNGDRECADDLDALLARVPEGETAQSQPSHIQRRCSKCGSGNLTLKYQGWDRLEGVCFDCKAYTSFPTVDAARRSPEEAR